jgi:L-aminopeptidase/D-esterase-like protein
MFKFLFEIYFCCYFVSTRARVVVHASTKLSNGLLKAVVEATEEIVLNSLCEATSVTGRDDHCVDAVSIESIEESLDSK